MKMVPKGVGHKSPVTVVVELVDVLVEEPDVVGTDVVMIDVDDDPDMVDVLVLILLVEVDILIDIELLLMILLLV